MFEVPRMVSQKRTESSPPALRTSKRARAGEAILTDLPRLAPLNPNEPVANLPERRKQKRPRKQVSSQAPKVDRFPTSRSIVSTNQRRPARSVSQEGGGQRDDASSEPKGSEHQSILSRDLDAMSVDSEERGSLTTEGVLNKASGDH